MSDPRHTQRGLSLIELLIFMVICGILAAGILRAFDSVLVGRAEPDRLSRAVQLAEERLELILGQRHVQGFAAFSAATFDPCTSSPPSSQPPCTAIPAGYVVSSSLSNNWGGDTAYKVVTVTVSGKAQASLTALVADY